MAKITTRTIMATVVAIIIVSSAVYFLSDLGNEDRVSVFEDLLDDLENKNWDTQTKDAKISEFMTEQEEYGFPIVSETVAYMVYYGEPMEQPATFSVGGDFYARFTQVVDTNLAYAKIDQLHSSGIYMYYFQVSLADRDKFSDYALREDGRTQFGTIGEPVLDPLNDLVIEDFGLGWYNIMTMAEAELSPAFQFEEELGTITTYENFTSSYHIPIYENRTVQVYLPPNYSEDKDYPTVYVIDTRFMPVVDNIFNYMSSSGDGDFIGVFVDSLGSDPIRTRLDPTLWVQEFTEDEGPVSRPRLADFMVNDVVPFIDSTYSTIASPESRAYLGFSGSAIFSYYLAATQQNTFHLFASLDAAGDESSLNTLTDDKKNDLRLVIAQASWSSMEELESTEQIEQAELLDAAGYNTAYYVFPAGHNAAFVAESFFYSMYYLFDDAPSDLSGTPTSQYPPSEG